MTVPDDEALLLELLNTTPVENGAPTDALSDDDAAAAWTSARGGTGTAGEVATVRKVREALQGVVRGDEPPERLAPFLVGAAMIPSFVSGRLHWQLEAPADQAFAVRAVLAWHALEDTRPGRLRACGNPDCRLFLIDRSHGNRAQWCSMAVCGNRMKARRHYERKRQTTQDRHGAVGGADGGSGEPGV
ncbi:CGNR zinc finger domain-containing protein [Georgenia satyanarayanai]|uniref:CGNR zinc finger domain-containing protein n=1 Tax=Georgenia satyanarayanai TaxID=860221 RepID=UPI001264EF3C|nr:CGNR zinc finger domain-containing protein [Georgenia satyanarayanai]